MVEVARKTRCYPSDLTDEEWVRVEPLMPKPPRRGRKPSVDLREVLNAIRYLARSGGGWRMLPIHFGPWQPVYWWPLPHQRTESAQADAAHQQV